jgi:hypothetical protein
MSALLLFSSDVMEIDAPFADALPVRWWPYCCSFVVSSTLLPSMANRHWRCGPCRCYSDPFLELWLFIGDVVEVDVVHFDASLANVTPIHYCGYGHSRMTVLISMSRSLILCLFIAGVMIVDVTEVGDLDIDAAFANVMPIH